jgi:hypothetical protein
LATCPDFEVPETFFYDLTPALLEGLTACPSSTDTVAGYLASAPTRPSDLKTVGSYLCNDDKCIYNWQNYLLWSLLARKKHDDRALLNRAIEIVNRGDDTPTRAGASLYLGAVGDRESKEHLITSFASLKSFIGQRCALVALHELPFGFIRQSVAPQIRSDLADVYRALQNSRGVYFAPIERRPLTELIDSESSYD